MRDLNLIPYAKTSDLVKAVARVEALEAARFTVTKEQKEYAEAAAFELDVRIGVPPDPGDE